MTIEQYLRALRRACRVRRVQSTRLVAEAADYLQHIRDRAVAQGTDSGEAERLAIEQFGRVDDVADRLAALAPAMGTVLVAERDRPAAVRVRPRGPGIAYSVVAAVLVVAVGAIALTSRYTPPPTIAEFAPQAVEQIVAEDGALGGGAQDAAIHDRRAGGATGEAAPVSPIEVPRVRQCVGDPPRQIEDPQSPPCVPYWSGDNGGASARGVTRDDIRVVDSWTGGTTSMLAAFFNKRFELYGRRIVVVPRPAPGADPAAQRAAARSAHDQDQAFAALSGAEYYDYFDELARLGIVSVHWHSIVPSAYLEARRPYLWSYPMANDELFATAGNWYCARFSGRNAVHAGDPLLQASRRKAGIILTHAEWEGTSAEPMNAQLAACGERTDLVMKTTVRAQEGFQDPGYSTTFMENAMLQMKSAGVTSLVCLCEVQYVGAGMRAATNQGYFPEWLLTSFLVNDWSSILRLYGRAEQLRHTMMLLPVPMERASADHPANWAKHEAGSPGYPSTSLHQQALDFPYRQLLLLASGVQMAGPILTPQTFERGLQRTAFPNPAHRIMAGAVGFTTGDYAMTNDVAEVWWSNTAPSPYAGDAPGTYCYVGNGLRRRLGTFPSDDPFFAGPCHNGDA